jgi:O-antigen/teichoic acid export membrane protein
VILGFVLLTSYLRLDVMWVNFSYVIGGVVTFLVNLYLLSKFINLKESLEIDKKLMKYLAIQSLPLGMMFVFSQINFKADSILLSVLPVPENLNLKNTETVAVYNLPFKIFEVALVIPTFLMNAVYPVFVRHLAQGRDVFKATFMKTTGFLFGLGVLGAIFGVVFAPLMINLLGGSEFSQSVLVLRLLIVGLPIFYVSQPISWLIVTFEKQKLLPLIYLVSAVFNLVLNFIYIPKYSFYASSALTWISELIILILLAHAAYKVWTAHYE